MSVDPAVPPPSVSRPPHPADGLTIRVDVGDGAIMDIPDPRSYADGGLAWRLTWASADDVKYCAAGVIESYSYLISPEITYTEAARRLSLLRGMYRAALARARGETGGAK